MKSVILLALLSVAFVGCESSQSGAENGPVIVEAKARAHYQVKNGKLTLLEKIYNSNEKTVGGVPYTCEVNADFGTTFDVEANERELSLTIDADQQVYERTSNSKLDEENYVIGQFSNDVDGVKTIMTLDENEIEVHTICTFKKQ